MKSSLALLLLTDLFRLALPGYKFDFPRDHFSHPEFQTEWWYYTGNLQTAQGRRFGFELTFFRQGIDRSRAARSRWDIRDAWLAHFALSDMDGNRFVHTERLNRAGGGLAGADEKQGRVWNGNWQSRWSPDFRGQTLQAVTHKFAIDLSLQSEKPPVIHGAGGVSQKAAGVGQASHYISLTRLTTRGSIVLEDSRFSVEGLAWMDHEFFTHYLAPEQSGWDWFSLQFEDRSELMLFQFRRKNGTVNSYSGGTYVAPDGSTRTLKNGEFVLTPGKTWRSHSTGADYPVEWTVRVPALALETSVRTRLVQQELASKRTVVGAYWEGAVEANGRKSGRSLKGSGYLEMTGYAGAMRMGAE